MKTILTLVALVFFNILFSQNIVLDTSFGTNGVVVDNIPASQLPKRIFYENNKYILILNEAVCSRNYDGSINLAFGNNGLTSFFSSTETFNTVGGKLQNGFIYIFGNVYNNSNSSNKNFFLAKMSTLGVFDNTFGNNGFMKFDLGSNNEIINDIVINPNGEIYAVGNKNNVIFMAKINSNGTLDTSFNIVGYKTFIFGVNENSVGASIYNYQDGYLLIGSSMYSSYFANPNKNLLIIHVDSNGDYINTFGTNGIMNTNLISNTDSGTYSVVNSKLISNNLYVSYHYGYSFLNQHKSLAKYDLSTNVLISNLFYLPFSNFDYVFDSNENFFITGSERCNSTTCSRKFDIWKRNSSGILDTTFNNTGTYRYLFTTDELSDSRSSVIYEHEDGKILIAGSTAYNFSGPGPRGLAMIRITDSPLSNYQFNSDDVFVISPNPANQILNISSNENISIDNIEVIDANGRRILTYNNGFDEINVENLQNGIYFINVFYDKKKTTMKFIKN